MIPTARLIESGTFRAFRLGFGGMAVDFQYMTRNPYLLHAKAALEIEVDHALGTIVPSGYHNTPTWFVGRHADCLALADALLAVADEGGPNCTPHRRAPVFYAWEKCLELIGPDAREVLDRVTLQDERDQALEAFKLANLAYPRTKPPKGLSK